MTPLDTIKALDSATITAAQAATVLGCNPQYIRETARDHPEWLQFPFIRMGKRLRIPRLPFIGYMEGASCGA